jgi:uncharacterized protein YxjI
LLHFHPTYHILSTTNNDSDLSLAHIKKKFTLIHKKFTVESVYGQYALEARNVSAHLFTLTKEERTVAIIKKRYLKLAKTYSVEIANDENQAFVLALVIVINQVLYD